MVCSCNAARLASVWGGCSTTWYRAPISKAQVGQTLKLSLEIAIISLTYASIIGTMAGIALAWFAKFRGRNLFSGLVTAPLIMPEVITGLSPRIFFILVAQGLQKFGLVWGLDIVWARGFSTVTLAHITLSMAWVTTIVQSRMLSANRAIEDAAMKLDQRGKISPQVLEI